MSGYPGDGVGKGGGTGGTIRDAGGAFGRMAVAKEEEYFYRQQKQQLEDLKAKLDKDVNPHQNQGPSDGTGGVHKT